MRKNPGVFGVGRVAVILLLAVFGQFVDTARALAQASDQATGSAAESQPPFQLKVSSNLVVVRVVVRDALGKPVEGLRKEDFKVFDRGKEQSILQFEVETTAPRPSTTTTISAPGQAAATPSPAAPSPPSAMPNNFVALYFDDLNTSDADMIYARDAADHYLAASLQPGDRAAIFTSDQMLSDFTADPQQIHAALAKLRSSARAIARVHECPALSDYQALEMTEQNPESSDAWQMALEEAALRCKIDASDQDAGVSLLHPQSGSDMSPRGGSELANMLRAMARNMVAQVEIQVRSNLQQLDHLVNYISQMPGRRTIILVSPGFLSHSEQYQLDRILDRAVRSQVVISSLDPRGLAPPREADASRNYIAGHPGASERLDAKRDFVAADVLAQVAQDTGGEFFRNNNDLKAGFGALAGSPVYYLLAFAPANIKPDGKFHALKVNLVEKSKGFGVQARRGYFAPKNEAEAEAEAKRQATSEAEAQQEERIREALSSKTDSQQLQVDLSGKLSERQGGNRELSIVTHLNAASLRFQKDGTHNLNTVTFVFAIFDQKENMITSQLKSAQVSALDAELPTLFKDGVTISTNFQLKPGTYRIREVVTDSVDHHLTAKSTQIQVP